MAKEINKKCLECSKLDYRKGKGRVLATMPECYVSSVCAKKRCYYRKLDYYRAKLRQYHRYLKFLGDKCLVCGSKDKLEVHHIKAQVRDGEDKDINLVTLCSTCHKVITIYNRRLGLERKLL